MRARGRSETDLGDRGRVIQTDGRSMRTAPPRTRLARSDRAQRRAPARSRTRVAGAYCAAAHVAAESRSWPPRPRGTKRAIARSSHRLESRLRTASRAFALCIGDPQPVEEAAIFNKGEELQNTFFFRKLRQERGALLARSQRHAGVSIGNFKRMAVPLVPTRANERASHSR